MILVLSHPEDLHVTPVVEELRRRDVETRVFDLSGYPAASTLTVDGTPSGPRTTLTWAGSDLDLGSVNAVWYRRPGRFSLPADLDPAEDDWLRAECGHLFRGLWATLDATWVSEPDAVRRAGLKLVQLDLATTLGLVVPRYTVTNSPEHASSFLESCPGGAIVKVLSSPLVKYTERAATMYTHLVTDQDRDVLDSVRFGPTFLQEFVPKTMDVRVTVIGERAFAVGIEPVTEDALIDFRRAEIYDLPHVPLTLPPGLEDRCVELVQRLGLRFGAIDLLRTPDGQYVFLEINPNGQWHWLEWLTGVPLTSALCDLLTGA
ncbi:MAG: hypothetical protein ABS81_14110 [Pseudonocardia sp. SCN 72-86]|nr:MAG: hypothetical protein ABS81_14110 [Pseudonocardia sp. SCN 72-86]